MTYVAGRAFATFAAVPQSNPTQHDKSRLLQGVGIAALELIALAVGAILLSSLTSCLWIWVGERNVMVVRKHVYGSVSAKDIAWFDTNMGAESDDQRPLGPGGLMAKFTWSVFLYSIQLSSDYLNSETDDVRIATSLALGQLLQYSTTCIAYLLLAFIHSWSLTLTDAFLHRQNRPGMGRRRFRWEEYCRKRHVGYARRVTGDG
jgi:ATP-binding cassette subfamily B (MDR/TAP) protein 1